MNNPYLEAKKKEKKKILLIRIVILILFFVTWEIFSRSEVIDSFLFSSPSMIYLIFLKYLKNFEIFDHIYISVLETVLGLIIGSFFGLLIAIILWWNKLLYKILDPFLVVLNSLPKTALAPIIIIWIGTGINGIVFVSISISLILTTLSAINYFNDVDEGMIKMFKSFNASKFQILYKLILPYNLTNIINIIKINIGMSWVGVIVGEFIVSQKGIGYLLTYGAMVSNLTLVMMGVIILAFLAYIMYVLVDFIENKIKKRRG